MAEKPLKRITYNVLKPFYKHGVCGYDKINELHKALHEIISKINY